MLEGQSIKSLSGSQMRMLCCSAVRGFPITEMGPFPIPFDGRTVVSFREEIPLVFATSIDVAGVG
jgi:hypothetical protein